MSENLVPEYTVFAIITDGMENSSHEYRIDKVKAMIENQQSKYQWKFIFLAANIDAYTTAESYGIPRFMAACYDLNSQGIKDVYDKLSKKIALSRKNEAVKWGTFSEGIGQKR